jgi:hypothetical protein
LSYLQLRRSFLEFLVLRSADGSNPTADRLRPLPPPAAVDHRQQTAALQVDQVAGHHDELAGDVDVQLLNACRILEVLPRDPLSEIS